MFGLKALFQRAEQFAVFKSPKLLKVSLNEWFL